MHSYSGFNNRKMCKDKCNKFNFDYKKLSNYHKGTKNRTSFCRKMWQASFILPIQQKINETIEIF